LNFAIIVKSSQKRLTVQNVDRCTQCVFPSHHITVETSDGLSTVHTNPKSSPTPRKGTLTLAITEHRRECAPCHGMVILSRKLTMCSPARQHHGMRQNTPTGQPWTPVEGATPHKRQQLSSGTLLAAEARHATG